MLPSGGIMSPKILCVSIPGLIKYYSNVPLDGAYIQCQDVLLQEDILLANELLEDGYVLSFTIDNGKTIKAINLLDVLLHSIIGVLPTHV